METAELSINGIKVLHTIVPIRKDGACLFGTLSYLMYGTQMFAQDIREEIVNHVVNNWEEFKVSTHNEVGYNYTNPIAYTSAMTSSSTWGSMCELIAAGQLYRYRLEVYENNEIYATSGNVGNPIRRLRFTGDRSGGHFDAYTHCENIEILNQHTNTTPRKRRARLANHIRRKKNKEAVNKYAKNNREVNEAAEIRHNQSNVRSHRSSVKIYQQNNPRVHRSAVSAYQKKNPDVHRASVAEYQLNNPEVNRASSTKYQKTQPQFHSISVSRYHQRHPEPHRASKAKCQKSRNS